jgi:hypothetical protein
LGCFGGGAYISNNFLGMNIRFRAKTRDLENGFLDFGIQKWDFLYYDTPAELMLKWYSTMVDEEGGGGGDTCKHGGVDKKTLTRTQGRSKHVPRAIPELRCACTGRGGGRSSEELSSNGHVIPGLV